MNDPQNSPPTAQTEHGGGSAGDSGREDWLRLAQEAYFSSTAYVDNNLRKGWEDAIRAFNSQHAADSKYNQPSYAKRSTLFRPNTRSIIRKNEAAGAAAFFSNMDVVSLTATDQSNKLEVASSEVMKEILQYRLTKSIPWFQILMGALQDSQTIGSVCAHIYWDYKAKPKVKSAQVKVEPTQTGDTEYPKQGELPEGAYAVEDEQQDQPQAVQVEGAMEVEEKPLVDKPCVDLIPIENLRIDPGANWTDPINSSPYVIHMMPMYVMDVKAKMESGEWIEYSEGVVRGACESKFDSTRGARQKDRQDPYQSDNKSVVDYEVCWVQRHIHRRDGEDWEFYTLSDTHMLTDAVRLEETVFHGMRPYVLGSFLLEVHKLYPGGIPALTKNLQDESNEVVNQRLDNVKFVLNKKYLFKRGQDVDIAALMRNVPGGAVALNNLDDVKELSWPDVTQSAYEEQSRIDNDMNNLAGNFSPAQVMADHGINGPARNMAILSQASGTLVEYGLRTFVETFVQPVLRQLVRLEQCYETDAVILALSAKKAQLFQKFGIDDVTDQLLNGELTLTVNVGMGATDPQMKLQKLISATTGYANILKMGVPGMNTQEIGKEIFGCLGYQDGTRFLTNDNPQILMMQQEIQKLSQMVNQLQTKAKSKETESIVKMNVATMENETKVKTTQLKEDGANMRATVTHLRAIKEAQDSKIHDVNLANLQNKHQNTKQIGMNGERQ